jgi:hypothetical protein
MSVGLYIRILSYSMTSGPRKEAWKKREALSQGPQIFPSLPHDQSSPAAIAPDRHRLPSPPLLGRIHGSLSRRCCCPWPPHISVLVNLPYVVVQLHPWRRGGIQRRARWKARQLHPWRRGGIQLLAPPGDRRCRPVLRRRLELRAALTPCTASAVGSVSDPHLFCIIFLSSIFF